MLLYEQAGLGFDAGGVRVERLVEAVTLIKGLLDGEEVTFAGRFSRPQRLRACARESNRNRLIIPEKQIQASAILPSNGGKSAH